jgi:hypothetical protein
MAAAGTTLSHIMPSSSRDLPRAEYLDVPFTPSVTEKLREAAAARQSKNNIFNSISFQWTPGDFASGVLKGLIAAFVAAAIYAVVVRLTGITRGYFSIPVGYLVGTAMMIGSDERGGTKYQVTAVALTYLSIAAAHSIALWWILQEHGRASFNFSTVVTLGITGMMFPLLKFAISPVTGAVAAVSLFVGLRGAWRKTADTANPGRNLAREFVRP